MADVTFVSRRDSSFREFPPASAQLAVVLPFYGDLTVWIRKPGALGWHFPASSRRSGETIIEVAKRELWESARVVTSRTVSVPKLVRNGRTSGMRRRRNSNNCGVSMAACCIAPTVARAPDCVSDE